MGMTGSADGPDRAICRCRHSQSVCSGWSTHTGETTVIHLDVCSKVILKNKCEVGLPTYMCITKDIYYVDLTLFYISSGTYVTVFNKANQ